MSKFSSDLELLVNSIQEIPASKKYWLVRTQSGTLFDIFSKKNIVSLDHKEITYTFLRDIKNTLKQELKKINSEIKNRVFTIHQQLNESLNKEYEISKQQSSLVASQIFKFAFDIQEGDTILIPSHNSDFVNFGVVNGKSIIDPLNFRNEERLSNIQLFRRIDWIKTIPRHKLDPYLKGIFSAHQAVNDITYYAEEIERSLRDVFVLDGEAHFVISIEAEGQISASSLFGLGSDLLYLVDKISEEFGLNTNSKDIEVSINLNSPGKIDLKSKVKSTTILAGLILAVFGGGYESKDGTSFKTEGLSGIIKAIDDYRTHQIDRDIKIAMFNVYKDSLQVKDPKDLILLMKQFSENKDLPK